jgi:hypothetical protein
MTMRDHTTTILYISFFFVIVITIWIALEEGKFPFNVKFLADTAYSKRKWGTPLGAFGLVFLLAMSYMLVRKVTLSVLDNQLYDLIVSVFKKNNLIVRLIKKKYHKDGEGENKNKDDKGKTETETNQ